MKTAPGSGEGKKRSRGRLVAALVVTLIILGILALLLLPTHQVSTSQSLTSPISVSTSSVPGIQPISITVDAVPGIVTQSFEYTGPFQVVISLTARPPPDGTAPFTYLWNFGDGTNSTNPTPVHAFPLNCAYDIQLRVTDATGKVTGKDIIFDDFSSAPMVNSTVVCPDVGTAGISSVKQEGGLAGADRQLQVLVDGTAVASPTTSGSGYWFADLSGALPPRPNGSTYAISVPLLGISKTFLSVEGINASRSSGVPGDLVTVEGRSYPPLATVSVYLGGAYLGQQQSDTNGSFSASFTVPKVSPLTQVGVYQFTTSCPQLATSCPVLGAQASFAVTSGTVVLVPSGIPLWVYVAIAVVVVAVLASWYLRRGGRRGNASSSAPAKSGAESAPQVND